MNLTEKELHGGLRCHTSLHVPKDHDERDGLAGGEGLREPGEAELGVRRVGGADAGGSALGGRVDVDGVFGPLGECLVEYRLVEGVWIAEEGVLTAVSSQWVYPFGIWRCLPQASVVLKDVVTAEIRQGERHIVLGWVRLRRCPEEQDRNAFVLVHPLAHRGDQVGLRDVLSTSR